MSANRFPLIQALSGILLVALCIPIGMVGTLDPDRVDAGIAVVGLLISGLLVYVYARLLDWMLTVISFVWMRSAASHHRL